MRYRLQRHDGTDCSATMVPITVLRMVPIQRYRQFYKFLLVNLNYNNIRHPLIWAFYSMPGNSAVTVNSMDNFDKMHN